MELEGKTMSEMKPIYICIYDNPSKSTLIIKLHFTQEIENLPFPMNLDRLYKFFISLTFMLVLGFGVRYRIKIFKYLTSDEVKLGPINVLIWLDQLNGLLLGLSILLKVLMMNLDSPLSDWVGSGFCEWIDLPGSIYLVGNDFVLFTFYE